MRFYWPIAKVDAEQRMVWGYASTEAEDDQGETITRDALAAALGDYMRFANIREMHQASAVGIATEAAVDDKGLYLAARIVDADAWQKVVEGVYKGFSIGGRVTARDPADRSLITGLRLTEISVVDRPANPEAMFDCWKRSTTFPATGGSMATIAATARAPVQIWDCGVAAHRHLAKTQAMGCIEDQAPASGTAADVPNGDAADSGAGDPEDRADHADPGYHADGRKRYPIDTDRLARIIVDLEGLYERIAIEGVTEGDDPSLPMQFEVIIAELHDLLRSLGAEESAEPPDRGDGSAPAELVAMSLADTLRKARRPDLAPLASGLAQLAGEIVPRLDALQKRVEEIARTPLPPQTLARGFAAISKREDGGGTMPASEDVVAALARMSEEERTMTLIKAAHASPTTPFGAAGARTAGLPRR